MVKNNWKHSRDISEKNDCERLCQEVLDIMDKPEISVCIFSLLETPKNQTIPKSH